MGGRVRSRDGMTLPNKREDPSLSRVTAQLVC
jgi:hypothetical protein